MFMEVGPLMLTAHPFFARSGLCVELKGDRLISSRAEEQVVSSPEVRVQCPYMFDSSKLF